MKMIQNDTFYYIKIGEDILKYGVDMIDHYSIHNLNIFAPFQKKGYSRIVNRLLFQEFLLRGRACRPRRGRRRRRDPGL